MTIDDPVVSELHALRDEAIASLRDRQSSAFNDILDFYFGLFDLVLNTWRAYGVSTGAVASPLQPLEPVPVTIMQRDLYHVIKVAVETQDPDLVGAAMYLPIRMLRLALGTSE